jgi:hypothetical protein
MLMQPFVLLVAGAMALFLGVLGLTAFISRER